MLLLIQRLFRRVELASHDRTKLRLWRSVASRQKSPARPRTRLIAGPGRSPLGAQLQREDLLVLLDAAQGVPAKRLESAIGNRHPIHEFGGNQDRAAQRLAKRLDARHLVDRRADDREIEPIDRADVAVQPVPRMDWEIDWRHW